jgi:hypothetical protein
MSNAEIGNHYQVLKEVAQQHFVAAAEASFAHYKQTGLHVSLGDVSDWVERLEADPGAPLPECHQ